MNKIIALLWLLTFGNAFAGDLFELAHSKKFGVRVLVEQSRGQWCQSHIKLRFLAENKSFFQGGKLQILMSKLSGLIKSECPLANSSDVYGYTNNSKKPVYQATTSPVDNWQLHSKAIVAAQTPSARLPPEERIPEINEISNEAPSIPSPIALQKTRQEAQRSAREKQRIMQKAQYDYQALKNNTNFSNRLSYLYGFSELTDPYLLIAQAVLSDRSSAPGILLVNVNNLDDDIAITDWPYALKIDGIDDNITSEGWYIIQGELEIEDIQHKNEQGLPQSVFFLEKSTQCKKEHCQEANELEEIIRHKYDLPEWEPRGNN